MASQTENLHLHIQGNNDYVDAPQLFNNFQLLDDAHGDIMTRLNNVGRIAEEAAYVTSSTGVKYKWGMDGTGIFLREV